ncbi:MAG: SDR family NAD(P)-dependent oxidoreductase [Beijerinckiaceae bacterium]
MAEGSTAAFQPGPKMTVCYATKSSVLSLSEALYEETSGTGVTVTCLCPGPTVTEFAETADMEKSVLFRLSAMRASDVAALGYQAALSGRRLAVAGLRDQILAFSTRLTPRGLVRKVAKQMQARASFQQGVCAQCLHLLQKLPKPIFSWWGPARRVSRRRSHWRSAAFRSSASAR